MRTGPTTGALIIMPRMGDLPRRRGRWLALAAMALTAALHPRAATVAAEDRLSRTLTVAPGQALAVEITNGRVRIEGAPERTDVRVEVERQAPSAAALEQAPLEVVADVEGPRLRVVQRNGGREADLRTDLRVLVPAALRLSRVVVQEGALELRGLQGGVHAVIERGPITADDLSGAVRLETTIGRIEVARARLRVDGLIRLRAFNGDVRLGFAAPLEDARVMALALNGAITSTVPLTEVAGWGPRWSQASIGRADRVVSIDVVNGAIRIDAPK